MLVVIGSIIILTLLGRVAKPRLPLNLCAICFGVSATWVWISAAALKGVVDLEAYRLPLAMLLGGSAVGIAYQGEYRFTVSTKYPLLWKTAVISAGLILAFWYLNNLSLKTWVLMVGILGVLGYLYFVRKPGTTENPTVAYLEEKLKRCC